MGQTQEVNKSEYEVDLDFAWNEYINNRLENAKDLTTILIEKYPTKFGGNYLLGHILRNENQLQTAVDQFLIALEKDVEKKNAGYIYYWIGDTYGINNFFSESQNDIYDSEKRDEYFLLSRQSGNYPALLIFDLKNRMKGGELINLLKEGITKFPESTDFYVLLANEYRIDGKLKQQIATLNEALEKQLSSASLFYNVGVLKFSQGEYNFAAKYFERAIEINTDYPKSNFGLWYWIGKANYVEGKIEDAKIAFNRALENGENDDQLLPIFGLLKLYIQEDKKAELEDLVLNLDLDQEMFNVYGRLFEESIRLASNYLDNLQIESFGEIYQLLSKAKIQFTNDVINGNIFLIRCFLALQLSKFYDAYRALNNARKYLLNSRHPILNYFETLVLVKLVSYKFSTALEVEKTLPILKAEMKEYYWQTISLNDQLDTVIGKLFELKDFKSIIELSQYYNMDSLLKNGVVFEVAYAYTEISNDVKAKIFYEYLLDKEGENSAVLNNLANIYKRERNLSRAIELYNRGLKLNPSDDVLTNNLQRTKQIAIELDNKATKEKALRDQHVKAIEAIQNENDYILEKLGKFIDQVKKEEEFSNWNVPIAKYKFHTFSGVDKQRGEQLREQWLKKGYLSETNQRDSYNAIIYSINPFLEEALIKVQKQKIPEQWLSNFLNISIPSLVNFGYFDLMDRIEKTNKKFRPLIVRDFNELTYNYLMGHEKATIVLSGSLIELVLTLYCERKKTMRITLTDSKGKSTTKKLYDCVLSDLIEYTEQTKPFGADFVHLSNLSRIYRNFIHPGRELKDSLDKAKADICFASTCAILRKII